MNKGDLKLAFTYVGALVGAGFATGQELVRFFVNFETDGLKGVVLAGIGFALLGAGVIILANKETIEDYNSLLITLFPPKLCWLIDKFIALVLWAGLGIMLSGSATVINENFALPVWLGFFLTAFLIFVSLMWGSQGLLNVNTLLVPLLVILALGSSLLYLKQPLPCSGENLIKNVLPNWWMAGSLYVVYNMVLGMVVLTSIEEKKSPLAGAVGGLLLGVMAYLMVKGMLLLPENYKTAEMPMMLLTGSVHPLLGKFYAFGLWVAIFTTAIANAHSLTIRLSNKFRLTYHQLLFIILVTAFCFLPWKFSLLVGIIYPLTGYLGFPLILAIIFQIIKSSGLKHKLL